MRSPSRYDIAIFPSLLKAGTQFTNHRGMHGWVDLVGQLHTDVVCQYYLGLTRITWMMLQLYQTADTNFYQWKIQ